MTAHPIRRIPAAFRGASALAMLILVACSAPAPTPPPSTAAPTFPAPTSVPTPGASLPAFACNATLGRPGSVPVARMSGLAVANEGGIGRITFTFRPSGNLAAIPEVEVLPGTPPFVKDPSGLPLEVAGTAFVVIRLRGGTSLDDAMEPTFAGPFDFAPEGSPIVDVRRAGDFEAVSTWVIGLDGTPCSRILPPDGSSRLVIELTTT